MQSREVLASVPFFASVLDAEQFEALAGSLTPVAFPRGAVLMRQGDIGKSMFVLAEGKVAIAIHAPGGERRVATLAAGDLVGEMSLLTGQRRSATVTALRKVAALEVSKPAIESLIAATPGLIERFARMMEQRHAELGRLYEDAGRWNSIGLSRTEIAAQMTAYFSG